jgi:hypothetical protein
MEELDLCGSIGKQLQVLPRVNLGTIKMKFANKNKKEKKWSSSVYQVQPDKPGSSDGDSSSTWIRPED